MIADRLEARMKEPVVRCLIRHLTVPYLYLEAEWPLGSGTRVDVLAIDRAGRGDAHVVEVHVGSLDDLEHLVKQVYQTPAMFRWLALPGDEVDRILPQLDALYPHAGAGRVGLIRVVEMAGCDLGANIEVKAERFHENLYPEIDKFVEATPVSVRLD